MSTQQKLVSSSPSTFLTTKLVRVSKLERDQYILVNKSRTGVAGSLINNSKIVTTYRIKKYFNRVAYGQYMQQQRKIYSVNLFKRILARFVSAKKFVLYGERVAFDQCIRLHKGELCSTKHHLPNLKRSKNRWPTALYEQIYYKNYKNRCAEAMDSTKQWKNFVNTYVHTNRYSVLEVEHCSTQTEASPPEVFEDIPLRPDFCRPIIEAEWYQPCPYVPCEEPIRQRDENLLKKIRLLILQLRINRTARSALEALKIRILNYFSNDVMEEIPMVEMGQEVFEPQMEQPSAHGEEEGLQVNQKSNVILTESRIESTEQTAPLSENNWAELCSSDISPNYDMIVDRWLQVKNFSWSKNSSQGEIIQKIRLPYDAIISEPSGISNMANTIPFTIHRYWKGDIEIKIQINSNKFQIGSLQCAWLYCPHMDGNSALRENIYSLSQTHHVLVNAAASNEASLTIPFKYFLPYLHTKPRADMPSPPLNLGTLYISVLNPLMVTTGGSDTANVSIFIRMFNNNFTGLISGELDVLTAEFEPQMDVAAADLVGSLCTLYADRNRDNLPQVTAPTYIVPTASHSWCIGTGQNEPLHPLRLDARGQVPHPPGIDINNEMLIPNIVNKFGLLRTIKWSKQDEEGKIIFDCDAAPLLSRHTYINKRRTGDNILPTYMIPPIGIASSMFMSWRGTIEFKFDIVCSQFHTGRLMVGYIPGARISSKIQHKHLRASPNMVFNLQEADSFTYTVPFISNKPMWPRLYAGDYDSVDSNAPSRLYISIVNKLIPMQSVPDSVYINIYMRAGSDFELFVPVQPAIGLSSNDTYMLNKPRKTTIRAIASYFPYYSGRVTNLEEAQLFRYGQTAHQIARFESTNGYDEPLNQVSFCVIDKFEPGHLTYLDTDGVTKQVQYAVFIYESDFECNIGIPCATAENAFQLSTNLFKNKYSINDDRNKPYIIDQTLSTTNNSYSDGNPIWNITWKKIIKYQEPQGERDMGLNVLSTGTVVSTNYGMNVYGEKFNDFKDLCRRYQLYGVKIINKFDATHFENIRIRFPVLPQGLDLDLGTNSNIYEIYNRGREGHIPLVASGYRYYRGGIRFRIVVNPKFDALIFVQHRPDRQLTTTKIEGDLKVISGEAVVNHSYASYVQLSSVNGVLEFEVPYYLMGMYGLLQTPKIVTTEENMYYSLGEMCIGISVDPNQAIKLTNCLVSIYYAMADDMSFSTFQGFPPMILSADIPSEDAFKHDFEFIPEMGLGDFFRGVTNSYVDDAVNVAMNNAEERVQKVLDNVTSNISATVDKYDISIKESAIKIALDVAQCIVAPNIKSVAIAVVKILMEMKVLIIGSMLELIRVVTQLLCSWTGRASNEPTTEATIVTQFEPQMLCDTFEVKDWTALVGLIFTGVCAFTGWKCSRPADINSFSTLVTKNVPTSIRSGNFLISFINATSGIITRIFKWIFSKVYPVEAWYYELEGEMPEIKEWVNEVLYILSKDLNTIVMGNGCFIDRVYAATLFGRELLVKYSALECRNIQILYNLNGKLVEYYEKMLAMGKHPFVRKEPFCIWVCGKPGIGKSFLTEFITSHMLRAIGYKLTGPKIFTVMPAVEFWTGCSNQPVLNMDDAFAVETPATLERQLNTIYMVRSPVALNPPMADLKDKHLRYNPEIFYINSNKEFLNVSGVDPEAIHRRRDILVKACLSDPGRQNIKLYSNEEKNTFGHLHLYIAQDPSNPSTTYDGPYTFQEFLKILIPMYKEYYKQETLNFERRLESNNILTEDSMFDSDPDGVFLMPLKELTQTRYGEEKLRYQQALENCLYKKTQRFIELHMFKETTLKKYLGPILGSASTTNNTLSPEMLVEDDEEPSTSTQIYENILDNTQYDYMGNKDYLAKYDIDWTLRENRMRKIVYVLHKIRKISLKLIMSKSVIACQRIVIALLSLMYAYDVRTVSNFHALNDDQLFLLSEYADICLHHTVFDGIEYILEQPTDRLYEIGLTSYNYIIGSDISAQYFFDYLYEFELFSTWKILHICDDKIYKCYTLLHSINMLIEVNDKIKTIPDFEQRKEIDKYRFIWQFILETKVKQCSHCVKNFNKLQWTGSGFVSDKGYFKEHCRDYCILANPIFSACWYICWLKGNNRATILWARRQYNFLPPFFHENPLGMSINQFDNLFFNTFKDKCKSFYENIIKGKIGEWLFSIATLAAILGTALGGYTLVKKFFSPSQTIPSSINAPDSADAILSKWVPPEIVVHENAYKIPTKAYKHPEQTFHRMFPQLGEETQNILRKLKRNQFFIVCEYVNDRGTLVTIKGRCLGIENNRAVSIRHYHDAFLAAPEGSRYYVETESEGKLGHKLTINYRELNTSFFSTNNGYETNFFIIYMPPSYPPFKKILSLLPKFEQLQMVGREGMIYEYGVALHSGVSFKPHDSFMVGRKGPMEPVSCFGGFEYSLRGEGVCGSILLSANLKNTPIIGMHVAGGANCGISEPLFRDMFEILPKQIITDIEEMEDLGELDGAKITLDTTIYPIGVVAPEMSHKETGKTAYTKSLLHGVFEIRTEPNPLRPDDPRLPKNCSPMKIGCEKHGLPVKPFKMETLNRAGEDYLDIMKTSIRPVRQHVGKLLLQDVICGNKDIPHFEKLEFNTSAGFGYDELRRTKHESGKKWLFKLKEEQDGYTLLGLDPTLKQIMEHKHNLRKQGIIPATIFIDCLKDTTLPIEKCTIPGKTRIFSISPVDFTIQFKQYYGDFLASYTKARFDAEHAIGINCDGDEWTDLAIQMQKRGNKIVSIDYTNYGPALALDVAHEAFRIIIEWYRYHGASEEHMKIMWTLAYEILNAKHLCFNLVYIVSGGIPSGSPITAPLNSICNSLYMRVIWMDIFSNDIYMNSLAKFHEHVKYITYGDDGIMNITDEASEKFNIFTIINAFAKYNIVCTDARKGECLTPYTTLLEASFLSRDFLLHPTRRGKWLAGLKKRSIEGCVNWVRTKTNDCRQATMMNSIQCLDLSHGWGPEYYKENAEKLRQAWAEHNEKFIHKTWEERDREIYEGTPNFICNITPFYS